MLTAQFNCTNMFFVWLSISGLTSHHFFRFSPKMITYSPKSYIHQNNYLIYIKSDAVSQLSKVLADEKKAT